jgi:2',3'-cyclic-nucleotide 2'-phosphodiesterase (5'-nucleotidase family)
MYYIKHFIIKSIVIISFVLGSVYGNWNGSATEVVIIHSNNSNGLLENCQCPEHAYGALEKRAFLVDSIHKKEKNVLLVESGDILDIIDQSLLHSYMLRAYSLMKYDAWVPGDQDFVEGPNFFKTQLMAALGTLLNTNIIHQEKLMGQKYLIKKFGTITIGITGTFNPNFHNYLDKKSRSHFEFKSQEDGLEEVLDELSAQCDYIILLSHSGMEQDKFLAGQFPAINLIIGGHSQILTEKPERSGKTYIVQSGESGYRLGIIRLRFKENQMISFLNKFILLDETVSDHPEVVKLIEEYHEKRLSEDY